MAIDKIGKFTVLDTLGSGAHSSILHVRRDADSKEYALKLVPIDDKDDLKYLEQAKHEFRVGQMLNHPNLVKVYCLRDRGRVVLRPEEGQAADRVRPRQDDGQAAAPADGEAAAGVRADRRRADAHAQAGRVPRRPEAEQPDPTAAARG